MRNRSIKDITWIDDEHFVCRLEFTDRYGNVASEAGYGWSKGGSFFMYRIGNGHIMKLGTIKRESLLDFRTLTV